MLVQRSLFGGLQPAETEQDAPKSLLRHINAPQPCYATEGVQVNHSRPLPTRPQRLSLTCPPVVAADVALWPAWTDVPVEDLLDEDGNFGAIGEGC